MDRPIYCIYLLIWNRVQVHIPLGNKRTQMRWAGLSWKWNIHPSIRKHFFFISIDCCTMASSLWKRVCLHSCQWAHLEISCRFSPVEVMAMQGSPEVPTGALSFFHLGIDYEREYHLHEMSYAKRSKYLYCKMCCVGEWQKYKYWHGEGLSKVGVPHTGFSPTSSKYDHM